MKEIVVLNERKKEKEKIDKCMGVNVLSKSGRPIDRPEIILIQITQFYTKSLCQSTAEHDSKLILIGDW